MTWRLCAAGDRLRSEVRHVWHGTTVWTVGDPDHASRPSDHNPFDHDDDDETAEVVTAIDVVGRLEAKGTWQHLLTTRDNRVEYAIFDGLMAGADTGWRVVAYHGSNQHRSHCHVSFGRGTDSRPTRPDLYDDPSPWGLATMPGDNVSWITRKWPKHFHKLAEELKQLRLINEHTDPSQRVGDLTLAQLFAVLHRVGLWIIREARR